MKEIKLDCRSIVIIIIWIYALAQPTCFIQSAFMDNIVQVGLVLAALLFMLAKNRGLRIDSLSLLYLLLILTAVVPDICSGNIEGTITQALSYVFPVLMYIIVWNAGDTERSIDLLYKLPIAFGVLLGGWTAFGGGFCVLLASRLAPIWLKLKNSEIWFKCLPMDLEYLLRGEDLQDILCID